MTAPLHLANPLGDRSSVSQKTFAVMECVGSSGRPLTVSEIAVLLDMPTPTVHRIVHQLEMDGLLVQEAGSRGYVPGPRLFNFALNVFQTAVRHGSKHAILERLSAATGETCNFGIISGGALLYADRVEASWPFGLRYEVGSRVPLHCTSMGKMLLAHQPKRRREHLLSLSDLHAYTDTTMTEIPALEEQFAQIRTQGYSVDNQEFLAGVICAAVPVRDARGKVCAAVAVSAPQARMPMSVAVQHVPRLLAAAEEISATWAMDEAEEGEDVHARI